MDAKEFLDKSDNNIFIKMKQNELNYAAMICFAEEYHQSKVKENELLHSVSGGAYRDELIAKTKSMEEFAESFYSGKNFKKGNKMGLENIRVHIIELYKKHYS